MMHICTNCEEIREEMWPAERTQDFHQNMTFDPIKDGTLGAASQKKTYVCRFDYKRRNTGGQHHHKTIGM